MNSTLFDLEHLQQLTYERSKKWATFLEKVTKNENLEEIDITNIDNVFGPQAEEKDSHDELASMEDEDCDDVTLDSEILRNVNNSTRFSLMFNSNATMALPESTRNEEYKLLDIFNQTLPIINEHNRQLKESGFEKILSTFDKQKIEDKVGSWLNRHNSLYGGDNTILDAMSQKERQTRTAIKRRPGRHDKNLSSSSKEISHDSDDSLQSGETARYIRSSRAGAIKNSSSTTTMIKTYRMVKSTREALREKYACEKLEDEYHLKALRHRHRFANELQYHHNHYDLARSQRLRNTEMQQIHSTAHKERRKVLRKRNYNNSCSTMETSSDSDNYYEEDPRFHRKYLTPCCNKHHYSTGHNNYALKAPINPLVKYRSQRSAIKMSSARMNRMYYYTHSQSKLMSTSSSSASFSSTCERRRIVKRNCKLYGDNRPCRRESECQCCNDRKLCEEYKHVADTSTDEWYVENCCSPQKLLKTPVTHLKTPQKSIAYETEKLSALTELPNEDGQTNINLKTNSLKNASNKNHLNSEEKLKSKSKANKTKSTLKATSSYSSIEDETFNRELQMAIEASKELYDKEQESKSKTIDKKEKYKIKVAKPLRKVSKHHNETEKQKNPTRKRQTIKKQYDIIDMDDEVIEKLPKLIGEKGDKSMHLQNNNEVFIKPQTVTANSSTTTAKNVTIAGTEETFFANNHTQAICNSTALSTKSQAYNRQINDKIECLDEQDEDEIEIIKENKTKIPKTTKSKTSSSKKAISHTIAMNKVAIKKVAANSTTVTSTTIRSPDIHSTLTSTARKSLIKETTLDNDDFSDCTLVTSTTNIESSASKALIQHNIEELQQQDSTTSSIQEHTQKGILIYAPENRSMAPAHSFTSDGYFTITKEHLSSVIGEKPAEKFLKYYIGRRRFNSNSTVYYRPPSTRTFDGNNVSSSSDSDDDLDSLGQYGDLYESLNKNSDGHKN